MRQWIAIAALVALAGASVSAQYLKYRDPKTPRSADGSPNMTAPALRLPDGKPDLGGLWNATDGRFLTNLSKRAGVEPPFTPWAAALFKELSLIHISEPTRLLSISYAVFCLKK